MPVTPFHFGAGGLLTALTRGRVSFLCFCASNVLIDVESFYNLVTMQPRVHTHMHTYLGATLAALAVVAGYHACRRVVRHLPDSRWTSWRHLTIGAVVWGALLGAWSHVLLDSIMHADITPLAPFSDANALHRAVDLRTLHVFCVFAGVVGVVWLLVRSKTSRRAHP
jgi:hypothetical protein